jgi:translation initiation factor 4E
MENFLSNTWTIWYDKPNFEVKTENWDQFLIELNSFNTIESFWNLLNNLVSLSNSEFQGSYHIFKKGIQPKWEDLHNINGGKWVLVLPSENLSEIKKLWEKTVSCVIGGGFGSKTTSQINGIVGNIRFGQAKITLWTKVLEDNTFQFIIGEKWKNLLLNENLNKFFSLNYFPHKN